MSLIGPLSKSSPLVPYWCRTELILILWSNLLSFRVTSFTSGNNSHWMSIKILHSNVFCTLPRQFIWVWLASHCRRISWRGLSFILIPKAIIEQCKNVTFLPSQWYDWCSSSSFLRIEGSQFLFIFLPFAPSWGLIWRARMHYSLKFGIVSAQKEVASEYYT